MKQLWPRMLVQFFCGAGCCLLVGLLVFGPEVFQYRSPLFQFVAFGVVGSLTFVCVSALPFPQNSAVHLLIFPVLYWISGSHYFLTGLFFYVSMVLSVTTFRLLIFERWQPVRYVRPFLLAACVTVLFVVSTAFLSLIYGHQTPVSAMTKNMQVGSLIGFGLGIGFEVTEFLLPRHQGSSEKTAYPF